MDNISAIFDICMCILWALTYTLVLIGTIKYKFPLISPVSQVVMASFEFAVLVYFWAVGFFNFKYVGIVYLYWLFTEIVIFVASIKTGYIIKKRIAGYLAIVTVLTGILLYFIVQKGYMLFFSYFNTIVGELIWFKFVLKAEYPIKPISLAVFIAKFCADGLAVAVYFGSGIWVIDFMCVLLPILDLVFILVYIKRKRRISYNLMFRDNNECYKK